MDNKELLSLLNRLYKIANALDGEGLVKEAGSVDYILGEFKVVKIAQMQRSVPKTIPGSYEMEDELATPSRITPGQYPQNTQPQLQQNGGDFLSAARNVTPQDIQSWVSKYNDPNSPHPPGWEPTQMPAQGTEAYRDILSNIYQSKLEQTPEGMAYLQSMGAAPQGPRESYMNAPNKIKRDNYDPLTGRTISQHKGDDDVFLAKMPGYGWLGGWNQELLDRWNSGQMTKEEAHSIRRGENLDPQTLELRKKQSSFWDAGQGTSAAQKAMNERAYLITQGIDPATNYDFQERMAEVARRIEQEGGNDPAALKELQEAGWVPGADKALRFGGGQQAAGGQQEATQEVSQEDQDAKNELQGQMGAYADYKSPINFAPKENETAEEYQNRLSANEQKLWERWYAEDTQSGTKGADYGYRVKQREAILKRTGRYDAWREWWQTRKRTPADMNALKETTKRKRKEI